MYLEEPLYILIMAPQKHETPMKDLHLQEPSYIHQSLRSSIMFFPSCFFLFVVNEKHLIHQQPFLFFNLLYCSFELVGLSSVKVKVNRHSH